MLVDVKDNTPAVDVQVQKRTVADREAEMWLNGQLARGRLEPFSVIGKVTPELADRLLACNPHNRSVSKRIVSRYATDMRNGQWEFNGESIKVSCDGLLNDGQHRLSACLESGVTIPMLFIFGLPRDSRLTLDQGLQRTVGHYFAMDGVTDANVAAAVARMIWQIENLGFIETLSHYMPTKQQIREVGAAHRDEIAKAVADVPFDKANALGGRSLMVFARLWLARQDPVRAEAFFSALWTGAMLSESHPVLRLREKLYGMRREKVPMRDRLEAIFRAWNAYYEGREIGFIPVQKKTKKMPKLRG